jgi:hypothetical protein
MQKLVIAGTFVFRRGTWRITFIGLPNPESPARDVPRTARDGP